MSLTLIFLLIALGLILLLIEIFVVPGTSIVGFSIWQAYRVFGSDKGHLVVIGTLVLVGITLVLAFKSNTWKRMMLNTNVDGRVNELEINKLHVGDLGKSVSRISPAGTALFSNELYEVHTQGDFIDQETEIVIIKIEDNKIIVKRK